MTIGLNVRIPEFRDDAPAAAVPDGDPERLAEFIAARDSLLVMSGAGCSTGSGIPAYRDGAGRWQRNNPIQYQAFVSRPAARRRYWARSYLGWPRMRAARPNAAHRALAALEADGRLAGLVTQNVDGLHQRAGSRLVTELHGSLTEVLCLDCGIRLDRDDFQGQLRAANPHWEARVHGINPDGDAELEADAWEDFRTIPCPECGGILKPDVVFFGESVPGERVSAVRRALSECNGVLVVGSSLVVWSGYRFVREAARIGIPVAAVNQGRTRADALLDFKLDQPCDHALEETGRLLAL